MRKWGEGWYEGSGTNSVRSPQPRAIPQFVYEHGGIQLWECKQVQTSAELCLPQEPTTPSVPSQALLLVGLGGVGGKSVAPRGRNRSPNSPNPDVELLNCAVNSGIRC